MNLASIPLWTEDFTQSYNGRTYTLNIPIKIGPAYQTEQLYVTFSRDLNKRIYIHDPRFFVPNSNPVGLPKKTMIKILVNSSQSFFYRIALTEVEELDIAADPCNMDPGYNFMVCGIKEKIDDWPFVQVCVKESLSRMVGCRTPWDKTSQYHYPLCNNVKQYK